MILRILRSDEHQSKQVDPFGQLPCTHDGVTVHTTNGGMKDDLLECKECKYVVTLGELFAPMRMPKQLLQSLV